MTSPLPVYTATVVAQDTGKIIVVVIRQSDGATAEIELGDNDFGGPVVPNIKK